MWRGKRLKILFASESKRSHAHDLAPGTVAYAQGDRIEIVCGDGTGIRVIDLQLEGKKRMSTGEFLRGAAFPEGEVLSG